MKKYILLIITIALIGISVLLFFNQYKEYSLISGVLSVILLCISIGSFRTNKNPESKYTQEINDILKTYDSILAKSNNIPSLKDKNIINIDSFEDLVDIELEVRKPICYFKQTDSCSFILIDGEVAYIYTKKVNDQVKAPIDIEIKEAMIQKNDEDGIGSETLSAISKTTIIKLANNKSYKVSPVVKSKNKQDNEVEIKSQEIPSEKLEEHVQEQVVQQEKVFDNTIVIEKEELQKEQEFSDIPPRIEAEIDDNEEPQLILDRPVKPKKVNIDLDLEVI